ncbi:MAG: hypothetical protein ACETWK_02115 [Candidatus Aminicenantaceae bacterium]
MKTKNDLEKNHCRYYKIAGITIQVHSDLPITDKTFHPKFRLFEVQEPGKDNISLRHHFYLPDLNEKDLGEEVYRRTPWAIYRKNGSWIYVGISDNKRNNRIHQVAVFNHDHTRPVIYNSEDRAFRRGGLHSLTLFPTDQILLARILADKKGCCLHSSGVIFDGKGLLFVGHSEAGKSTMVKMLKDKAKILCDDRMIVRRWEDGFRIHGTWSHGEVPDVSPASAPLKAILFLHKDGENRLVQHNSKRDAVSKLLPCLVKPLVTADWWEKTLALVEMIVGEVPCYSLCFDKTGRVEDVLKSL